MDQPGGALVRGDHAEVDSARIVSSTQALEQAIREYLAVYNEDPKPFVWTKRADQILESLQIYREEISDTGHYYPKLSTLAADVKGSVPSRT